jgi:hypothetical protein
MYWTQSNLNPGNCWQTAIACILDEDPLNLPPQDEIEAIDNRVLNGWGSYRNVLNGYLTKHYNLMYFEVQAFAFGGIKIAREDGLHLLIGPTVRTANLAANGAPHIHHVVIGRNGEFVWDVHPSRAGLTRVESWGILGSLQAITLENREYNKDDEKYNLVFSCLCPKCGLNKLRELVETHKHEYVNPSRAGR